MAQASQEGAESGREAEGRATRRRVATLNLQVRMTPDFSDVSAGIPGLSEAGKTTQSHSLRCGLGHVCIVPAGVSATAEPGGTSPQSSIIL